MDFQKRFVTLCGRLYVNPGIAESCWNNLSIHYSEPHRHYHNLFHIRAMLEKMDQVVAGNAAMELAIWYHDVIYDPRARDNEEQSAGFFEAETGSHMDADLSKQVVTLILATDYARERTGRPDEDLIRDIDLSILAASPEIYQEYARAVRGEYAHVPDEDFRKGRCAVMERFLAGRIFHTAAFADAESIARTNILEEARALKGA